TKYYLIQKYNQLYKPPNRFDWKIRYCKKEILIDIDKDKYVKLRSYDGTPYCVLNTDTLIFLESSKFNDYRKKKCDVCGDFTYCAMCLYDFHKADISESKQKLEKVTPAIDIGNFIYYYINNCINCRQ
ncbi:36522_t:CDS:1, partial [Racocetra persica]